MEGCILDYSEWKQANKYVWKIWKISDYVGVEYKEGGDIILNLENKKKFVIPRPTAPENTNSTPTEK